ESYLGVDRTNDLGEERRALNAASVELLRAKEIAAVFAVGTARGLECSRARLQELGLHTTVYAHATDVDLPTIRDLDLPERDATRFTEFLEDVASRALI